MRNHCILGKGNQANPRTNLYIFPHSGGMPGMYMEWGRRLDRVNIWGVQYPGRGSRISEAPCLTLADMVADVLTQAEFVQPYILMGHSLGAIVAYEIAARVPKGNLPAGLIVSAMSSPDCKIVEPGSSQINSDALLEIVRKAQPATLANLDSVSEFMEHSIEVLRNDIKAAENYVCNPAQILPVPIVFMGGKEDSIPSREQEGWGNFTVAQFERHVFKGGHFYFQEDREEFFRSLNMIIDRLSTLQCAGRGISVI
jgi:surfactin synthase thioesterase subunit